jgi:hypothetical protein
VKWDRYEAYEDRSSLGEMAGLPQLYADTMLIVDCVSDRDLDPVAHIRTGHGLSFEAIAAKYPQPVINPECYWEVLLRYSKSLLPRLNRSGTKDHSPLSP